MKVALTGSTGNMGKETLAEILKINEIEYVKLLVLPEDKRIQPLLKKHKSYRRKIQVIFGNLKEEETCKKLVSDVDYVLNLAAVIPPLSDKAPQKAVDCNQIGVDTLVACIEALEHQPKLIHISTVALYGNHNHLHPWVQVGDPLLVSPFDIYSATKLRGEFRVLESNVKDWVVLRQTAMFHRNMLKDNMKDGLMFHTCFNAPLEWVTAHDSGVLIANILRRELQGNLEGFWRKVFNIGGGEKNCITGYDTLNDGFGLIGGSTKHFFKPYFNATRNFHGVWFYDGEKLDHFFHYQSQSVQYYWKQMGKMYWYYKLGRIVPKSLISNLAIQRLFKDSNSPAYWYKHKEYEKITAYFGSKESYEKLCNTKWEAFHLLVEDEKYSQLKNKGNAQLINYYFDYNKKDEEITLSDLQKVAEAHGGSLLTTEFQTGDIYRKLEWKNQDNQVFIATPYTILRAGHWVNRTYFENVWDFDRLSKKDKLYSQVWYDSHNQEEAYIYSLDKEYNSRIEGLE